MNDLTVTIGVLLFGDYAYLADRCLKRLVPLASELGATIRLGLNAVSPATQKVVDRFTSLPHVRVYASAENIHKYPMMRRMFYDAKNPVTSSHVMWFDDDSFLQPETTAADLELLLVKAGERSILGMQRFIGLNRNQTNWVRAQPWYHASPPLRADSGISVTFLNGAWWIAPWSLLQALDYPWHALDHRGGDVMFGVAAAQCGYKLRHDHRGIAVNADIAGISDKAKRRGFNQKPIGWDYNS